MHKFIRLAVVLGVIALLLATAVPALAAPPDDKGDYEVAPVRGGPHDPEEPWNPPGAPTVSIPNGNPAIAEEPWGPGDVFWPIEENGDDDDDGNG